MCLHVFWDRFVLCFQRAEEITQHSSSDKTPISLSDAATFGHRLSGVVDGSRNVELRIAGMTCASCASRVEKALEKLSGAADVAVDPVSGHATLRVAPSISNEDLAKAIRSAGYDGSVTGSSLSRTSSKIPTGVPIETTLSVRGMTCSSCSSGVESALSAVPGVVSANVSATTHEAIVVHIDKVEARALIDAVVSAGFEAEVKPKMDHVRSPGAPPCLVASPIHPATVQSPHASPQPLPAEPVRVQGVGHVLLLLRQENRGGLRHRPRRPKRPSRARGRPPHRAPRPREGPRAGRREGRGGPGVWRGGGR